MPNLRAFIALPTSDQTKTLISTVQSELKDANADVRWEQPEKFHITLKFLGDCEQATIASLQSLLQLALKNIRSFDVIYQTIGGFPNSHHPRIVWIGASENPALTNLQMRVEETCAQFDFEREDRSFHPHITLGRVKSSRNLQRLTEKLKTVTFEPFQDHCHEVHIVRSELKPSGSVYTLLHTIPLQS